MSGDTTQHVFIIGSKSIGYYGGYETFVERLVSEHENDSSVKYHVACKANGSGHMDETVLSSISDTVKDKKGNVVEFTYKDAHVFKIHCPNIGPAVAIYYDRAALKYALKYCRTHGIKSPVFYILTCRIGLYIDRSVRSIKAVGGRYFLNPDGHEWMRQKWSKPVRKYWKWSESKMVKLADKIICDSVHIEEYIKSEYSSYHPNTTYIAYGADVDDLQAADSSKYAAWLSDHDVSEYGYYLIVGRFVPENNYETMIREFMKSSSHRSLVIVSNTNQKFLHELNEKLHFESDKRIKFVGTVYDQALLKTIRRKAYAYLHGHEVGGTNPSLLEAMGTTSLNLLLDVGFNREVGEDAAWYWDKGDGSLSAVINEADGMDKDQIEEYAVKAKRRISGAYSWRYIGERYLEEFLC